MTDADIHEFAVAQLSCLNDYHQQLTLCRQRLSQLMHEKVSHEQQITRSESMLQEHRQRLSGKQKRLANLRMLREQVQMKMSLATTLASDVEKLKEKHSTKERHLRQLIGEVERLTAQQQKLQQELNAQVMSTGLMSADINSLTDQIAWTDECNTELDTQLNYKHEKMRQQLKHLEALRQNIILLNQQLETNGNGGIGVAATSGILRQNANYRSLPVGTRPQSLIDHVTERDNQRANVEHSQDTLSTQKFDIATNEDDRLICANSFVNNSSSANNIDLQATVGAVASRYSQQMNNNIGSHSEDLQNTSYRMVDRFSLQQGDMQQLKQPLATSSPNDVDHNIPLSSQYSAPVANTLSTSAESVHMRPALTVNALTEIEPSLHSKGVVHPSSQLQLNEVGLVSPVTRPSVNVDGRGYPVLLPDVIGYLSDNVSLQNTIAHDSVPYSSKSSLPLSASRVPPPVAEKPKFRFPHLSGYDVTSHNTVAAFAQPGEVTTMPPGSADAVLGSPVNNISSFPNSASFTLGQNLSPEEPELQNIVAESPLNVSADQSETFADDNGNDFADCGRAIDRPAFKPTIVYPVRRRLSVRDESESCTSMSPSVDTQAMPDVASVADNPAVCSDGSMSKVQTVKHRLQPGMSRKVQFEPLALLLDAALEGELDLLQTTLKVCDASAANDEGITALHNAICAGHLNVAEYLVNCGCDINAPDNDGWTPLHCAASCNNTAIARLLVDNGACVFATALSDHEKPSEKCDPDEDDYEACLHFLQDVEMQMQKPGAIVYAAFDYIAENTDELTFTVGDELTVMQCNDDVETEWWWCRLGELKGYIPQNLLALHPRVIPS